MTIKQKKLVTIKCCFRAFTLTSRGAHILGALSVSLRNSRYNLVLVSRIISVIFWGY